MTKIILFTNNDEYIKIANRKYHRIYTTFDSNIKVACKTVPVFSIEKERYVIFGFNVCVAKNIKDVKDSNIINIVDFDFDKKIKSCVIDSREYFAYRIELNNGNVVFEKLASKPKPKPKKAAEQKSKDKQKPKDNNKSEAKGNADKPVQK